MGATAQFWVTVAVALAGPAVMGFVGWTWNRAVNASEGRIMAEIRFLAEGLNQLREDWKGCQIFCKADTQSVHGRVTAVADRVAHLEGLAERRKSP